MITGFLGKLLLSGTGIGILAYLSICLALFFGQQHLIFLPSSVLEYTPKDLDLAHEDVWLSVLNLEGKVERIHGWWIPARNPKNKVLLYLHGNGGNISSNLGHARRLQQLGFSVLLIDYRGYGRSEGQFPTEATVYKDAQIAWDYLVQQREILPKNIFIYGHSLGGAIAIDLAVRKPNAAGLIVESSLTSMREMVKHQPIYSLFPADLILTQRFDSLSKLKLLKIPFLLIHGTNDRTIPATMSQRLFESAKIPKRLFFVANAGHNDVASTSGENYLQQVREFEHLVRQNQHQLADKSRWQN